MIHIYNISAKYFTIYCIGDTCGILFLLLLFNFFFLFLTFYDLFNY